MRLKTVNESIHEETSPEYKDVEIDGEVWTEGGSRKIPVVIKYTYFERGNTKVIKEYSYSCVNPKDSKKVSADVDDDVRDEIGKDADKHEFDV